MHELCVSVYCNVIPRLARHISPLGAFNKVKSSECQFPGTDIHSSLQQLSKLTAVLVASTIEYPVPLHDEIPKLIPG